MRYAMLANAVDPSEAVEVLEEQFERVSESFSGGLKEINRTLKRAASGLSEIPMVRPLEELPRVLIAGEIYVRKEELARRRLPDRLAREGFLAQVAPLHEWFYYIDWLIRHADPALSYSRSQKVKSLLKYSVMRWVERRIKRTMARSKWYLPARIDIGRLMKTGEKILSRDLYGEAILTIAGALVEAGHVCGVISIGPFGCMPNRLAESILNVKMEGGNLLELRNDKQLRKVIRKEETFPFLSIESDGGPFTQLTEAQLEVFMLQAARIHERLHTGHHGTSGLRTIRRPAKCRPTPDSTRENPFVPS
jgi:predicted nucleotide-binding protein (sugar kinase/HSP70/actin superfamily)